MKILIIGYGSVGTRHARILGELGCQVAIVSRREVDFEPRFPSVAAALAEFQPETVLIANRTNEHHQTLLELIDHNFRGTLLIEKPLFDLPQHIPAHNLAQVYVTYNMRFHPLIQRLRELLKGERILSVQAYVGQYLPNWRPQQNYRDSYSARRHFGGGALRDLSHELDFLLWLLGSWQRVTALGGQHSHLEIDSDDVFAIAMATEHCPVVTVQLNYLDRIAHRDILVNTDHHTIRADLFKGIIIVDQEKQEFAYERDLTYRRQHEALLRGDFSDMCTVEEGVEVVRLIAAVEKAAEEEVWITR